jgi:hypothetical protein
MGRRWSTLCVAIGVCLLGSCRETTDPIESSAHVVNDPGYFATYQAVHLWPNTGTSATIENSTTVRSGSARLSLIDPHERLMYDSQLGAGAATTAQVGAVGSWSLIVTLTGFAGTVDFRVRQLWLPPAATAHSAQ